MVTGGSKDITQPLQGAGQPNAACDHTQPRIEDDAEDGQSLGLVIKEGKFSFAYFGDMDWNPSYRLFCPNNLVGHVDVYLITHHGQSFPKKFRRYPEEAFRRSRSRPILLEPVVLFVEAEVWGIHPRVAVLSMGADGHKLGNDDAMKTVDKSPGIEGVVDDRKNQRGRGSWTQSAG